MTCIHEKKRDELAEFNLLHDILNPPKLIKHLNIHYFPILQHFVNT